MSGVHVAPELGVFGTIMHGVADLASPGSPPAVITPVVPPGPIVDKSGKTPGFVPSVDDPALATLLAVAGAEPAMGAPAASVSPASAASGRLESSEVGMGVDPGSGPDRSVVVDVPIEAFAGASEAVRRAEAFLQEWKGTREITRGGELVLGKRVSRQDHDHLLQLAEDAIAAQFSPFEAALAIAAHRITFEQYVSRLAGIADDKTQAPTARMKAALEILLAPSKILTRAHKGARQLTPDELEEPQEPSAIDNDIISGAIQELRNAPGQTPPADPVL